MSASLAERQGVQEGEEVKDHAGSMQLLTSVRVGDRDRMLLRSVQAGSVWKVGFALVGLVLGMSLVKLWRGCCLYSAGDCAGCLSACPQY